MDLGIFINKSGCECLNESDGHHLSEALAKGPGYLESDCDEQVRLSRVLSHYYMIDLRQFLKREQQF